MSFDPDFWIFRIIDNNTRNATWKTPTIQHQRNKYLCTSPEGKRRRFDQTEKMRRVRVRGNAVQGYCVGTVKTQTA